MSYTDKVLVKIPQSETPEQRKKRVAEGKPLPHLCYCVSRVKPKEKK